MKVRRQIALLLVLLLPSLAAFAQEPATYSIPAKRGALVFPLPPSFTIQQMALVNNETQLRLLATDRERGITLSFFVQPAEKPGDAKVCRDTWWSKSEEAFKSKLKIKMKDKRLYERGSVAFAEFINPEFQGVPVNQKSVRAYLAGGDIWAEIHISKVQFKPSDQAMLDEVLDAASVLPDYVNAQGDYLRFGSLLYMANEFKPAARHYQQALDLEKQSPSLDHVMFKVLVDNLGMAYGISGDLTRAKSTFEYGLSKYPDHPLFHYNMACTYGEMGDMENAIAWLKTAFDNRKNALPGEAMPDPMTDDSFRKFVKKDEFRKAVEALPRD